MSPERSAAGMNSEGGMLPRRGWFQRTSASNPITVRSARLTIGWKRTSSCLPVDRPAQVVMKLGDLVLADLEGWPEGFDPVSALPVGMDHGEFRVAHDVGGTGVVRGQRRNADGGRQLEFLAGELERRLQCLADGIGEGGDAVRCRFPTATAWRNGRHPAGRGCHPSAATGLAFGRPSRGSYRRRRSPALN